MANLIHVYGTIFNSMAVPLSKNQIWMLKNKEGKPFLSNMDESKPSYFIESVISHGFVSGEKIHRYNSSLLKKDNLLVVETTVGDRTEFVHITFVEVK